VLENKEYLKKVLILFFAISLPIALAVTIVSSWQVGLVFGGLSGLFMSFHLGRTLAAESFEINSSNKDRMKGLSWYEEEIISHLKDLRYYMKVDQRDLKVWEPSPYARTMGGEVKMEVTPYAITITGPRGVVRILKSILDLDKIFI
jgi:hypothetical protein